MALFSIQSPHPALISPLSHSMYMVCTIISGATLLFPISPILHLVLPHLLLTCSGDCDGVQQQTRSCATSCGNPRCPPTELSAVIRYSGQRTKLASDWPAQIYDLQPISQWTLWVLVHCPYLLFLAFIKNVFYYCYLSPRNHFSELSLLCFSAKRKHRYILERIILRLCSPKLILLSCSISYFGSC